MEKKNFLDCERKQLEKMSKYQLPNKYKKVGIALFVVSFIGMFITKLTLDETVLSTVFKYGLLIGLLLITIAKEKLEDEFITKLRMQSFTFAFIFGVIFSLIQPFIRYAMHTYIQKEEVGLTDIGDFEILWMLLTMHVFFFHYLKRLYK